MEIMARKHFEDDEDNPERWMVSYADFITLLFAFFVVMYAISAVNVNKYRILTASLGTAFGRNPALGVTPKPIAKPAGIINRPLPKANVVKRDDEARKMDDMAKNISSSLSNLVQQGMVRVSQTSRGVDVEINASLLFPSGEAKLSPESLRAIQAIATTLQSQRYDMEVDGYSDDQPIKSPLFPSNWELSAVRASSVARALVADGIAENRLKVVGYGSNDPVVPNDTPEDRARNRRVELVILSPHYEAARETLYHMGHPQ